MGTFVDNSLILNTIKSHYKFKNDAEFARFLEIKANTLSNWYSRNTIDYNKIITKCVEIDANWLLTGKGEMLKEEKPVAMVATMPGEGIPLIPLSAMAGVASGGFSVLEQDCERFVIPMFSGADYLIPVKGSSMYPKYSSGDVVACKIVPLQDLFFQWNKVYVLDTVQGPVIKRVQKCNTENAVTLVSENPNYPPFELSLSQIYAVSVVIGVVRLE